MPWQSSGQCDRLLQQYVKALAKINVTRILILKFSAKKALFCKLLKTQNLGRFHNKFCSQTYTIILKNQKENIFFVYPLMSALVVQWVVWQTVSKRGVGLIPIRHSGLGHYTEHMIEVTQLVYNQNIICNCIVINKN